MKGGLGTASIRLPGGAVVGALVAVNALGDVVDPENGGVVAGARDAEGTGLAGAEGALLGGATPPDPPLAGENTTIGVVATNVTLQKHEAKKVAQMAHDGLARSIRPVHTPWDGDTLFAVSTGGVEIAEAVLLVGTAAAAAMGRAVVRAVQAATGLPGLPSASDLGRG
jgi:L-aminopeptidase/D-esterase-like protein